MIGSVLSNMLLVLGCCFLVGGIRYREQKFNTTVASTMSSLMAVSSASLIIPATLYAALASNNDPETDSNILLVSHCTSVVLLIVYVMYLYFQMKSHSFLFEPGNEANDSESQQEIEEEEEERILTPWAAGIALVVVTVLVSICADKLVSSIDSFVESSGISRTFIGLILIPIVGNAAEHVTAGKFNLFCPEAGGETLSGCLLAHKWIHVTASPSPLTLSSTPAAT